MGIVEFWYSAVLIKGYKHNDFPNRQTRRKIAKRRGFFRVKDYWKYSNMQNKNVQTYEKNSNSI